MLLAAIGVLAFIAAIVMFVIACISTTPFGMQSRIEGLAVVGVMSVMAVFLIVSAHYFFCRWKRWMMKTGKKVGFIAAITGSGDADEA